MYKQERKKYCKSVYYAKYASLDSAKKACTADPNCYGIYDRRCDNVGVFGICSANKKEIRHSPISCIYAKQQLDSRTLSPIMEHGSLLIGNTMQF